MLIFADIESVPVRTADNGKCLDQYVHQAVNTVGPVRAADIGKNSGTVHTGQCLDQHVQQTVDSLDKHVLKAGRSA